MRAIHILIGVILFAVFGVVILVAVLWLDHTRETTLPIPTGPFAVGRTTYAWSQAEHMTPPVGQPAHTREILAWVWYPAVAPKTSQAPDEYLPAQWRAAYERQRGMLLTKFLTRDLSRVRTHSFRNVEPPPSQHPFPVLLMRAGLAILTTDYTSIAEDLASHGYVVVGFDAPYRSFVVVLPDGKVIARTPANNAELLVGSEQEKVANRLIRDWSSDMVFALDQMEHLNTSDPSGRFRGRLDMQHVGVFGHSLGGAVALQFCHDDPRCKAGVDVDGAPLGNVIQEGVTQPFMFLLSDHRLDSATETREVQANIRSITSKLPSDQRLEISIRGASHFGFSDDGAMLKSPLIMGVVRLIRIFPVSGRRQIALTSHCISSFFDVYLKGAPASKLHKPPDYPEIDFIH